ncbi:hypothetical protein GCM10009845_38120 [Pedococcus bigeumensis]
MDGHAVDVLDETVPLPALPQRGGEHLDLVTTGLQLRREVMRLDLYPAQPGQVTVRQQGHLHRQEPAMRQDGR